MLNKQTVSQYEQNVNVVTSIIINIQKGDKDAFAIDHYAMFQNLHFASLGIWHDCFMYHNHLHQYYDKLESKNQLQSSITVPVKQRINNQLFFPPFDMRRAFRNHDSHMLR